MGNLFAYLDWRGDLPFSVDPFSDVDNLVLAELAYTDFDGVVPESGVAITIREARDRYFELHTREEILARTNLTRLAPLLLDKLADSRRYEGLILSDYLNIVDTERDEQIAAVTYQVGDGTSYAAFRGTDDSLTGWKEDFSLSYRTTAGQRRAVQYLNEVFAGQDGMIRVGGHSKGGNFAVYAAAFCMPGIRNRISRIYTNDGPGFREAVTESPEFIRVLPKVMSIVPEESVIGALLSVQYRHTVVRSSAAGIWQHDPLSWEVLGNHFLEAEERSAGSLFFEKTIQMWLRDIDDETRESFVDSLFSFFAAAGAETPENGRSGRLRTLKEMRKALRDLPQDKQAEFMQILLRLVGCTMQNLMEAGREFLENRNRDRDDQKKLDVND